MENRRFHRVKFTAQGDLRHQTLTYQVRLENLSLKGALVSSEECLMVSPGDSCTLSIRLEEEDALLVFTVEVVHSFFSMVGVHFVGYENDAEQRLIALLKRITSDPEKLDLEVRGIFATSV